MEKSTKTNARAPDDRWLSGHLYYHQSLDQVMHGWVRPLVISLVEAETIDAFFFLRYALGGPHVRLRLHTVAGAKESVAEAMRAAAETFVHESPSASTLDDEVIQGWNKSIVASDPHESDTSVYPDNSFHLVPFRPEVDRYGGLDRLQSSLDLFALSSIAALQFLTVHQHTSRGGKLGQALIMLFGQAAAFASDAAELADLLRYAVDAWGEPMVSLVEKGQRVADQRRSFFRQQIDDCARHVYEVKRHASPAQRDGNPERGTSAVDWLLAGMASLSTILATSDRHTRARIGGSQLHMTASRLGLTNAEEVYLSSLLTATLREAEANRLESVNDEGQTGRDRMFEIELASTSTAILLAKALSTLRATP